MPAAQGIPVPHIFLSYSRRDGTYVDSLAVYLERSGFRIWVDRKGITGGEQWRREIVTAIQKSSMVVLFLSPNSARSENVRKELDLAEQARVRVLPVTIAPTDIPDTMKYQLAGVQMVELWRDNERAVDLLVGTLRRHGLQNGNAPASASGLRKPVPPAGSALDLSDLGGAKVLEQFNLRRLLGWKR